jgi:lycopene cyclase-like protein
MLLSSALKKSHVVVLGAGPAGLALAAACAQSGLDVLCVGPRPRDRWHPNYGCWADELNGVVDPDVFEVVWSQARVAIDDEREVLLDRPYGRLSTERLQAELLARCRAAGVVLIDDRAEALSHLLAATRVTLRSGTQLTADVVVDATGHRSPWVERVDDRQPGFQTAYGRLVELEQHDAARDLRPSDDAVTLMDFRGPGPREAPSFLYAMPLGGGRAFVEETSLVQRPKMPFDVLRQRLDRRLSRRGLRVVAHHGEAERCLIPMGVAPPKPGQRTVAFGGAAAMVHPASGYMLARVLRLAPAVGAAIAAGLDVGGPRTASEAADELLWPRARRRCWELYTFGMEVLCELDLHQTRAFFDAFFRLPPTTWRGFLDATLDPSELCVAMLRVFAHATSAMRARILHVGATAGAGPLLRALNPPSNP